MKSELTLIIPTKNEKESLPVFLKELKKYRYKILIVVDPKDPHKYKIKKNRLISIKKQKKPGYGNALIEGINSTKTKYFSIINADGSMDPKDLDKMLKLCKKNNDFIFASRYLKNGGSDDDTTLTFIGNKIFSLIGKVLFDLKISDILFTYILGKTSKAKKLKLKSPDFKLCVEIPIKQKRMGYNYNSIPSFERKRIAGKKKVNEFIDGLLILFAMFYFFFNK